MKAPWALASTLALAGCFGLAQTAAAQATTATAPAAPKKATPKAGAAKAPEFKMVMEPRAVDLLKTMSARLAAAKSMSFTGIVGYEFPSKLGPPLLYTTRYDVTLVRPDKLRVLMPGDGPASEFYYDGKTMLAYAPAENLAAVSDAPSTIDAMLKKAFQTAAIYFPFTDLVIADPYAVLADGKLAFYVGPSGIVGGVKTEMVAWANDEVFLQIWLGVDDKLPRRVRAMFNDDPLLLRHDLELSNWQLDGPVAAETFVSAKALAAGRMAFAAPTVKLPPGVKPLALKKSPTKAPSKSN
jgi:hypothetical protein